MAKTCDECGCKSELDKFFVSARKSFHFQSKVLCPKCYQRFESGSYKAYMWAIGIIAVIGIMIAIVKSDKDFFLLKIDLMLIFLFLLIIPHELGHAIAAKLLGIRFVKIIIGRGDVYKTFDWLGCSWELRMLPIMGLTVLFDHTNRFYRLKRFLIVLAGPLVNGLLFFMALHTPEPRLLKHLTPVNCFMFANLWLLAINLFPYQIALPYGKLPTDGLALLTIPFLSKSKIDEIIPFSYVFQGHELLNSGRYNDAENCYRYGLSRYPENKYLEIGLGASLINLGDYTSAKAIFIHLMDKDEPDIYIHSLIKNNLAYAIVLNGDHDSFEEADIMSKKICDLFPWVSYFTNTRAAVLIELGRFDEGISLLNQAMDDEKSHINKASNMIHLAVAGLKMGYVEMFHQHMKKALEYDPKCPLIGWAQSLYKKYAIL